MSVIANSHSKKVDAVEFKTEAIRGWTYWHSAMKTKKMPKLADFEVVQLQRGSRCMYVKTAHGEEDFRELELSIPTTLRAQDQGIEEDLKMNIKKLVPLMPCTRSIFWSSLAVSSSKDYDDYEEEDWWID